MKIVPKSIFLLLVAGCLVGLPKCTPTGTDEDPKTTNVCESEEFVLCEIDDRKCENMNKKIRLKRKKICEQNSECSFCNLKNDDLIAGPKIVPTLSPPIDVIPVHETATIDTAVPENQPILRNKKESPKLVERNIIIENDNETKYYHGYIEPSSNITTIIRLTNLINNTNIVNMSTTLNNTNINNIHVYSNKSSTSGGKFGLGYTEDGPCCWAMKPRSCKKTTSGSKCQHKRAKECGKICKSKIIHPNKKPCSSIPQWLYPQQSINPFYPQYAPPIFEDYGEFQELLDDNEILKTEPGWVVMQEKCKIVSEDGLQIFNCTDDNNEFEHPFARNSVDDRSKRSPQRAAKFVTAQQQAFPFNGFPVYILPIPIYVPQNFQPQQLYANNYQQLPFLQLYDDDEDHKDYNVESNPNRKFNQENSEKHPVILEHDDEF